MKELTAVYFTAVGGHHIRLVGKFPRHDGFLKVFNLFETLRQLSSAFVHFSGFLVLGRKGVLPD
jgi:hypothetical protein